MKSFSKNFDPASTAIFLHIPKTAGTTLISIIKRQYPADVICSVSGLTGIQDFKDKDEQTRQQIRMLMGHAPFGLHSYLPQPAVYFTLLRDPVERIISLYHYILRSTGHKFHQALTSQNMSLADYVTSGISKATSNCQTWMVAGGVNGEAVEHCSRATLEIAKTNLDQHIAVVGTLERFDETLILLREQFGWSMPFYAIQNATLKRPQQEDFSPETIAIVQEYNALDAELYAYANQKLDQRIQSIKFYPLKLANFQSLNWLYGKLGKVQ